MVSYAIQPFIDATLNKNQVTVKTFIVEDFVMSAYRDMATENGYIVQPGEHQDEFEVTHQNDNDFCEIVSGYGILWEYLDHNNNNRTSYATPDLKLTFLKLDEQLTQDAKVFGMEPHRYLQSLNDLQNCYIRMDIDFVRYPDFDPMKWVEEESFKALDRIYKSMPGTHRL